MSDRDEFDDIVGRLDFDLQFPTENDEVEPNEPVDEADESDDLADPADEPDPDPFYRHVHHGPARPRREGHTLAWFGVLGAPLALVMATMLGVWLPRPIIFGAGLIFVAGAIFLFSQLPEHGPSRPDWPDDGAVL